MGLHICVPVTFFAKNINLIWSCLMFFRNEFHPLFNTMRKVGKCSPSAKCTGSSRGLTPKNRGEEQGARPSHSSAPRSPAAMHGGEEQGAPPPRKENQGCNV